MTARRYVSQVFVEALAVDTVYLCHEVALVSLDVFDDPIWPPYGFDGTHAGGKP